MIGNNGNRVTAIKYVYVHSFFRWIGFGRTKRRRILHRQNRKKNKIKTSNTMINTKQLFLALSLLFSVTAKAQEVPQEQTEEWASEIEKGEIATYDSVSVMSYKGLYGLVDHNGMPVTSFKYSSISKFSNGFAIVRIDSLSDEVFENDLSETYEKFGIINSLGKEIVPVEYDNVSYFKEDLGMITKNYKSGFINKEGEIIIPIKYNSVELFSNGLALATLIDSLPIKDSEFFNFFYKVGFINKRNEEIIPIQYSMIIDHFNEGYFIVRAFDMENYNPSNRYTKEELSKGKWGYFDSFGKKITPLKYDGACEFSEGLAIVNLGGEQLALGSNKVDGGLWGFIDKTGKEVIPLIYDEVWNFSEGRAKVKLDGETFYIDKTGKRLE